MGNFVEALGRSQAITQAITGIQGIQQNELAIQNSKMQQAINEHTYKKAMEAETEANRLVPMDQILNQLEPEVKDFWIKSLQPYLKNGESGGLYIPMKHSDQVKNIVHDENFNMQTDKITLDALIKKEKLLQTQKAQMLQPDTEGKAQKQDKDAMVAIEQQITDIQKRKTELDQALDVFGRRKKEREDFTLQQGEKRFSGTGTEIATGEAKADKNVDQFNLTASPNDTLEFRIKVRSSSPSILYNVIIRDIGIIVFNNNKFFFVLFANCR